MNARLVIAVFLILALTPFLLMSALLSITVARFVALLCGGVVLAVLVALHRHGLLDGIEAWLGAGNHPLQALSAATGLLALVALAVSIHRRRAFAALRWPRAMPANEFRRRCEAYLRSVGFEITSSRFVSVDMRCAKDGFDVAVVCREDGATITDALLDKLKQLSSVAIVVNHDPPDVSLLSATALNIGILRYDQLPLLRQITQGEMKSELAMRLQERNATVQPNAWATIRTQ